MKLLISTLLMVSLLPHVSFADGELTPEDRMRIVYDSISSTHLAGLPEFDFSGQLNGQNDLQTILESYLSGGAYDMDVRILKSECDYSAEIEVCNFVIYVESPYLDEDQIMIDETAYGLRVEFIQNANATSPKPRVKSLKWEVTAG